MRANILCRERLERIQRILARAGGEPVSVRNFARTFSVWEWELNQAAEHGWIEIIVRKPKTGRPSRVVISAAVNKNAAAKLPPCRRDLPKDLSNRHHAFLNRFFCKRGLGGFFGGGGAGSAFDAYTRVYAQPGVSHPPARASRKSAGARLARQPWMRAAWLLRCRLDLSGFRRDHSTPRPEDLRSRGEDWLRLLQALDGHFRRRPPYQWPREVSLAVSEARTVEEAAETLSRLPSLQG